MPENKWYAYLLCCRDGSLYCGITTDLSRRLREHNEGRAGARYTRTRRPVTLVYSREFPDRAAAARFEYQLKQLDRPAKLMLIAESEPVQIL
jgi:putative endonuclease